MTGTFIPNAKLSRKDFSMIALDYLVFGNCYVEKRFNHLGDLVRLAPSLAKYTRRGVNLESYYFINTEFGQEDYKFKQDSILHLLDPDINQEVYGLPEYISAMQAALLNENATLFRRRYYKNGSHAGYIMYLTDPQQDTKDINALREAIKSSKGPGNFKNLFMYSPNGKKDGLQIIPLSEVAAKDEFLNIKNVTRDDILAAHRVPPQLMGIMPNVTGGFGDAEKAAEIFNINEIKPLQIRFEEINDMLGEQVISFTDYRLGNSKTTTINQPTKEE